MSSQQDDPVASALSDISICLPLMVAKPTRKEEYIVAWGWDFQFSLKHLTLIQLPASSCSLGWRYWLTGGAMFSSGAV